MSYKNLTDDLLAWVGDIKAELIDKTNIMNFPYSDIALKYLADKDKAIVNFNKPFTNFIEFISCSKNLFI
jgi:hypothetical protein